MTGAILAVGNLIAGESGPPGLIVTNPWAAWFADGLVDRQPVVVVGTGLTMVDVFTSSWLSGFSGPVLAISRRGLLPRTHVPPAAWQLSELSFEACRGLSQLVRAFRREVEEARQAVMPWQSVMDAVRPITTTIWRELSPEQQARFIRHLRPWLDVHRHRMAPPVSQQLHGLMKQGFLQVASGKILSVRAEDNNRAEVRWSPRGATREQRLQAQRVIYATGNPAVSSVRDPLIDELIRSGLARMDPLEMGLDVTADLEISGTGGRVAPGLWGIGPITRKTFWECTAVPDIRNHAERLARRIGAKLMA